MQAIPLGAPSVQAISDVLPRYSEPAELVLAAGKVIILQLARKDCDIFFLKNVFNFDLIDLVVAHPLVGVGHGRVAPPDGGGSYEMCERKIQCKKG